jgi:hypothetical protein
VKLWISILVAGAILAFAAASAFSAVKQIPVEPGGVGIVHKPTVANDVSVMSGRLGKNATTITVLRAKVKALTAKNKKLAAYNESLSSQLSELYARLWVLTPHPDPMPYDWDPQPTAETSATQPSAGTQPAQLCASLADPGLTGLSYDQYDWSC